MLSPELQETIQGGYRAFLKHNNLKPRLGQKQMIAAIANALGRIETSPEGRRTNDQGSVVVEAGTGTGKTLAYLLAAIPFAQEKNKKVVVSTGTIALQEQLAGKDLPALCESTGWAVEVAIAKGRGRYMCPIKLSRCLETVASKDQGLFLFDDELAFDPAPESVAVYKQLDKAFAAGEWDGNRDDWPELIAPDVWQPLTIDRRQCSGRRCRLYGQCPFYQARDQLEEADCIIANHDLTLSDLALGGGAILPPPEETIYIFDEAHRLPEITIKHFSASSRLDMATRLFGKIGQSLQKIQQRFAEDSACVELIAKCSQAAQSSEEVMGLAAPLLRSVVDLQVQAGFKDRHRFKGGQIEPALQETAIACVGKIGLLANRLAAFHDQLGKMLQADNSSIPREDVEQCHQQAGSWLGQVEHSLSLWMLYAQEVESNVPPVARWLSLVDGATGVDIEVSASPTHPGELLSQQLYQRCFGLVLTSATLRALGRFDDFIYRLGLPEATPCRAVTGVFDHYHAATLQVPDIGADGSDPGKHTQAIADALPGLLNDQGGVLVLFSSRQQMEEVFELLDGVLQEATLMQSQMPIKALIDTHKERIDQGEVSIIFGLASFAEGVDLPGNYCSQVIIAKLPFAVPDDPIQGTVSDWLEENGRNAFFELSLPQASLRLNQACGRLLRTESDTGRITILDRRILTRRYGKQLLNGLPPYRQI